MIRTTALAVLLAASFPAFAAEQAPAKLDLAKAKEIAEGLCVACHAADGNSPTSANPILAGQIPSTCTSS
jgi:cytochrome c553